MKKKILAAGLCLAMAVTALCACNPGNGETAAALSKANDVYGVGAVSTVKLLGGETSAQALGKLAETRSVAVYGNTATDAEDEAKAQAEKFNEYFTALDSFMGKEIVTTVSEKNTDEKYPYETKLTINSKDFNGNAVQNIMYFTETLDNSHIDDDDDIDDKDEKDEEETTYKLNGVLVVDGKDYALEGERSLEQEEDETEDELKIRAYADIADKTSYVEMSQEYSVEDKETETEYVYSVYSNGELVEQTAVEFETEKKQNKEEAEYELEFRKGEAKGKYEVDRETKDGRVQIKVKYNIDGKQGNFHIIEKTNENGEKQYEYSFSDNTKLVF